MRFTSLYSVALFALSASATAAPFLVCDTYPTASAQPIVTPASPVEGDVRLYLDLGPLNLTGAQTVTAKAKNVWGESANSAPFSFTAGSPAPPGAIGLSAN